MDGLADQTRRPHSSPGRIAPDVEVLICEMRRHHRRWGARRIAYELTLESATRGSVAIHDTPVLVRTGVVNSQEQQHKRVYKRWAREAPVQWQLDIVGGAFLVNGREHKMLTAIDDHSRFVVAATVLPVPSGPAVSDAFLAAIARWGVPFEVLTDNGKQFTGKFTRPLSVEVLFERICRENGSTARLTNRRSSTTTGKVERFHRTLRRERVCSTRHVHSSRSRRPRQRSTNGYTPTTLCARTNRWTWPPQRTCSAAEPPNPFCTLLPTPPAQRSPPAPSR